jgi:integrase
MGSSGRVSVRRFSIHRRGKYFYCQFWVPETGSFSSAISTRQTNRNAAIATVADWIAHGIPDRKAGGNREKVDKRLSLQTVISFIRSDEITQQDAERIITELQKRELLGSASLKPDISILFCDFLETFWDYDTSPYVQEKLAHNQTISRRTCYDRNLSIKNYWRPAFSKQRLVEITKKDLKDFSLSISRSLSAQTVNHIMNTATIAFRWAYVNDMIPVNPADGLRKFTVHAKKRDILTLEEARDLFSLSWDDQRTRVASLVAMTTGLRAGEIAALRLRDVGDDYLTVDHAWSEQDGMKTPKNGESRTVPVLPYVRDQLREVAMLNPNGVDAASFVFWSTRSFDRPMAPRQFSVDLQKMLAELRLQQGGVHPHEATADQVEEARAYWTTRNVVFHSWRHFYASQLASRIDKQKAMVATGHRSSAVFDVYANHENRSTLEEVGAAVSAAFSTLFDDSKAS